VPENALDYGVIKEKLLDGLVAAVNLIERYPAEKRAAPGLQPMLLVTTRNVQVVYQTIAYICSESGDDPWRKPDFVVAALPLARTIADALSTVAFVLADPVVYTRWYWASGWREYTENLKRLRARNHPAEATWVAEQEQRSQEAIEKWSVPREWAADPKKCIPWWPTMSRLAGRCLHVEERALFKYLDEWCYKLLSSSSHSTAPGLRHGAMLLLLDEDQRDRELVRLRSAAVFVAITLTVAYLSELRAGIDVKVMHLPFTWTTVANFFPPANELYALRYQRLLRDAGA
jgi:hypothetical protein